MCTSILREWLRVNIIVHKTDDKQVNGDKEGAGTAEEAEDTGEEEEDNVVYYDKAKSFFDNISCEATAKSRG